MKTGPATKDRIITAYNIKRDIGGSVVFAGVGTGLTATGVTAGADKTLTTSTNVWFNFTKMKAVLGTATTPKIILKRKSGGNTTTVLSTSKAGNTKLTVTVTNMVTALRQGGTFSAKGTVAGGTAKLTFSAWINDMTTIMMGQR